VGGLLQGRMAKLAGLREVLVLGGVLGACAGLAFLATVPWVRRTMAALEEGADFQSRVYGPAEEEL